MKNIKEYIIKRIQKKKGTKSTELKECIRVLEEDLKDEIIHPSTIANAQHTLKYSREIIKFVEEIEKFYRKKLKEDIKEKDPHILSDLRHYYCSVDESIYKYVKNRVYTKLAEGLPINENYEAKNWYRLFPGLEGYVNTERCKRYDDSEM